MLFVTTQPAMLTVAATDLRGVGAAMASQNAAAATVTSGVIPAAADEVSGLTATQFASHAAIYQAVSAIAMQVHETLVSTLDISAGSYAATEAANAIASG